MVANVVVDVVLTVPQLMMITVDDRRQMIVDDCIGLAAVQAAVPSSVVAAAVPSSVVAV